MIKFIAFIILLLPVISSAQKLTPDTIKKVDAYLDQIDKMGFSGVVMIADNGKPVISRGYGFSDRENKVRNSPKTVFDIGSITKQFTAAAILKLEMRGKLSTDDRIGKYFQNVPPDKRDITIHDLLRHQAGLPGGIGGDYEKITEQQFLDKLFATPLRSPVGTKFGYSNVGYSLLTLIVEKVSGQPYEKFLYENLWKPSGMEMTGYSRPRFNKTFISVGYRDDERWGKPTEKEWPGAAPYLHLLGNGGILSTTEDLLKWDRALAGDEVLSKAAKQKYYFPVLRADENGNSHYAYGWDVTKTDRNTTRIWHNGSNGVFYADFYRFIDEGVTMIIATNVWQPGFREAGGVLSRIIFVPDFKPPTPVLENPLNAKFTKELIQLTLTQGLSAAVERFNKRDRGLEAKEDTINARGYELMREKKLKEAIEVFKLNVHAFPRSGNVYDSLGEALLESGDRKGAVENYKKSLELDPENENAREVLKKLGEN